MNAAKLLRLEGEIGELRPGFTADLIGIAGNPLDSTAVLANPAANMHLVMRAGKVVFRAE